MLFFIVKVVIVIIGIDEMFLFFLIYLVIFKLDILGSWIFIKMRLGWFLWVSFKVLILVWV